MRKKKLLDTINKGRMSENLCITDCFIKYVHEFKSVFQNRKCIYFERVCKSKPKSNTRVFGLGFSFAKIQVLSAFFGCRRVVVSVFSGFI